MQPHAQQDTLLHYLTICVNILFGTLSAATKEMQKPADAYTAYGLTPAHSARWGGHDLLSWQRVNEVVSLGMGLMWHWS